VIRMAITQSAFEAIARTLPFGSVSFENKTNENGERLIWLEPNVVEAVSAELRSIGFHGGYDGAQFLEWYRDLVREKLKEALNPEPDLHEQAAGRKIITPIIMWSLFTAIKIR
jgi:hypothetical protein